MIGFLAQHNEPGSSHARAAPVEVAVQTRSRNVTVRRGPSAGASMCSVSTSPAWAEPGRAELPPPLVSRSSSAIIDDHRR